MKTGRSRLGDILAGIGQAGMFLVLIIVVTGALLWNGLKTVGQAIARRMPSASEAAVVFPQFLVFLFLLVAIPVTVIGQAINASAQRILDILKGIEAVASLIAYVTAFALVFAQVMLRELFDGTIGGAKEAAILGAVIAGFLGFSLVTSAGAHLRANFLDGLAPKTRMRGFNQVSDLVSVVLLLGFAIASYIFVRGSYAFNYRVVTILIPLWPFQIVMIYAFGAAALKHLIYLINPDLRPAPPEVAH